MVLENKENGGWLLLSISSSNYRGSPLSIDSINIYFMAVLLYELTSLLLM